MREETRGLEAIKAKMTGAQRKEMASLLANELRNREAKKKLLGQRKKSGVKSSRLEANLSREDIHDIYRGTQQKLGGQKENEQGDPFAEERAAIFSRGFSNVIGSVSTRNIVLIFAIALLACGKIMFSSGIVNAAVDPKIRTDSLLASDEEIGLWQGNDGLLSGHNADQRTTELSSDYHPRRSAMAYVNAAEKRLLQELDQRRVELEKRREALEEREAALTDQETRIAARLAELKSINRKLSEYRKQKDHRYEARLEQLANVYGSMPPNEAAPLMGKLDENIALALLQRMPGKRMGQILSLMDDERAIELTRLLSGKQEVQ